jgi:pentatricopeptide repeat protein
MSAGFSPNYSVFSWLVDGFHKKNNADAVLLIPDELVQRGLSPDKSVYRSLIRRLCKKGLVDLAQKALHQMQGKGLEADCLVYAALAYAQLTAGKLAAASDMLNEMAKKQMSVTPQIYNCMCTSYGDEKETLNMFWVHAIERGLIGKNVYKLMHQARLKASKPAVENEGHAPVSRPSLPASTK